MSTQRNRQGSVSRACACGRFAMAATARLYRGCSVIAGLALMLSCGDSHAGDVYWNNSAGGAFGNSANWNAGRVPGAADVVYFTLNNTYDIGFSASYTNGWTTFNAGNVTLDIGSGNTLYVANEFRGSWSAGTSLVTMKSGNLSVANGLCYIGSAGNCTMTISNGLVQLRNVYVGNNSGSVGNWNIAGGTNTLSTTMHVGVNAGSTGTVFMTGGNLSVANNDTTIGYSGNGTMTISDGVAQFKNVYMGSNPGSVGNWNIAGGTNTLSGVVYVGNNPGSTGTVLMTGGSLIVPNANTLIGNTGKGTMTISNGVAQFNAVYVGWSSGSVGNWNIAGGTNTVSGVMYAGHNAGSTGTVSMTGGSLNVTNADTIIANSGKGTMTISNGVAQFKTVTVGYGDKSAGTLNISDGLVQSSSILYVGRGTGSRGNLNIAGGANTFLADMYLGNSSGSTGIVIMTGGSLIVTNGQLLISGNSGNGTMTIANGVAKFKTVNVGWTAGSIGMLTVIGTNAVITCNTYIHQATATSSTLSELFCNGGVSPITCSGVATLSGVLTLGMNGSMGLLTTDAIPLINAGSFSGGFGTTNRSVFAVSKTATKLLATLDSSYRSAGGTLVNNGGLSFSATNQGWVAVSTNGMTGSTFDLNLLVLANNATHTVSDLVSVLKTAGYTATNSVISGDEWLTLTLPVASWSNPAFAWDLTNYDPMMAVRTARIGSIPAKGTMIRLF